MGQYLWAQFISEALFNGSSMLENYGKHIINADNVGFTDDFCQQTVRSCNRDMYLPLLSQPRCMKKASDGYD